MRAVRPTTAWLNFSIGWLRKGILEAFQLVHTLMVYRMPATWFARLHTEVFFTGMPACTAACRIVMFIN